MLKLEKFSTLSNYGSLKKCYLIINSDDVVGAVTGDRVACEKNIVKVFITSFLKHVFVSFCSFSFLPTKYYCHLPLTRCGPYCLSASNVV